MAILTETSRGVLTEPGGHLFPLIIFPGLPIGQSIVQRIEAAGTTLRGLADSAPMGDLTKKESAALCFRLEEIGPRTLKYETLEAAVAAYPQGVVLEDLLVRGLPKLISSLHLPSEELPPRMEKFVTKFRESFSAQQIPFDQLVGQITALALDYGITRIFTDARGWKLVENPHFTTLPNFAGSGREGLWGRIKYLWLEPDEVKRQSYRALVQEPRMVWDCPRVGFGPHQMNIFGTMVGLQKDEEGQWDYTTKLFSEVFQNSLVDGVTKIRFMDYQDFATVLATLAIWPTNYPEVSKEAKAFEATEGRGHLMGGFFFWKNKFKDQSSIYSLYGYLSQTELVSIGLRELSVKEAIGIATTRGFVLKDFQEEPIEF